MLINKLIFAMAEYMIYRSVHVKCNFKGAYLIPCRSYYLNINNLLNECKIMKRYNFEKARYDRKFFILTKFSTYNLHSDSL